MDSLSGAVSAVLPPCINPVLRNITYPFKVSNNVKSLDLAHSELMAMQADLKNRVASAELQGLQQSNRVQQWLGRVEAVKEEVDEIKRRYEERSWRLRGRSLDFWSNYWISKEAAEKLKEVQDLCMNGEKKFEEVVGQHPPFGQELPVASKVMFKEELDLQEICRYIDNHDDNIIGIWGMGGVGKTRLLRLVHNSYIDRPNFDVVIFMTVSHDDSVETIQAKLCEKYSFGRESSVESQARIISNYLLNRSFLLLLDDLWDEIDLQRVGIPFPLGSVSKFKRKVVITTREFDVCRRMDVNKSHKVACLANDDALRLFHEKVGDETISSHPLIPSLTQRVVAELDGLPLALITIGRAMHGKENPREWEDVIDRLQKSRLNEIEITRDEEKTYYQLKLSYDSLETKELRDCFLACSLWPEDWAIRKTDLIECWLGLGILNASDARNIYNPGYTLIGKLVSACLLEQRHAESDSVKMHDVIRDMAIWIACDFGKHDDKWIVLGGVEVDQVLHQKDRWCQVERATLMVSEKSIHNTTSIPRSANKLNFLRVCCSLVSLRPLLSNLESFCGLTFLDLSHCGMDFFPSAISNLVNLRYLNLSYNDIRSVPEELKLLTNLNYLFLGGNRIVAFPKGVISELRELRVLDLYGISIGEQCEYLTWLIKELQCLDKIRSLEITLGCAAHFQSLLELPNLPIKSLSLVWFEEIDFLLIPSSFIGNSGIQDNLNQLFLMGESVKKLVIESDSQNPCHQLKYLEHLNISGMEILKEIIWRKVTPEDLFMRVEFIEIMKCPKLKDVSWTLYLPCLQVLSICECENMVQLIKHSDLASATEKRVTRLTPFPSLTLLELKELPALQMICDESIMFRCLRDIYIKRCQRLTKLPFRSNTVPRELNIYGEKTWWEQLEWKDQNLKSELESSVVLL